MTGITIAVFMAVLTERLVNALITPFFEKFHWDLFYLKYIAWLLGGILCWITGVNLVVDYVPNPLFGQILTAVIVGGGANLLHDIFIKGEPEP